MESQVGRMWRMLSDFQLGAWRVQPQLNSLACDLRTVRLEPKMMGVLLCLVQRSGDVVSKEQIVQEVWQGTFVTDDVLIRCVSELRKAFGDDAGKPTFIETIPKRGYRLLIPAVPIDRANHHEAPLAPKFADSIAVLPFENDGLEPEMEYLSDGVAETIINNLSRLQDLRVVPRTTTFEYKRRCMNPTQVGRALAARLVLTGHVAQRGDRLIVGAELIDSVQESQLWGNTYDRKIEEIFTIQEEIARRIPNYLQLRLTDAERQQVTRRSTESREAYHFLLKAVHFAFKYTPEGFGKGLDFCRQAIEADPVYADAYALLSFLYSLLGTFGVVAALEAFPRAKAAALKALEIDDSLADAHAVLGFVHLAHDWNFRCAEMEFRRAIELGPHMPGGHYAYSQLCLAEGRYREAVQEAERAVDLDPLSLPKNYHLGAICYFARQYDAAIAQLNKTIELDPSFVVAHNVLAAVYALKGMPEEAIAEGERARSLSKGLWTRITLGRVHAILGNQAEAREILTEVKETSKSPNLSRAAYCAMMHAWLGEPDQAVEWLEKAYGEREPTLIYLRQSPDFEILHDDPRFHDLLQRIGLAV
jgi:TolB-like protein/Flp pilus assembly protein TadD